jgi:hypothetical protein
MSCIKSPEEIAQQQMNTAEVSYLHLEPILNLLHNNESVKHFYPSEDYLFQLNHPEPCHLTKQEIESLRQDAQETHQWAQKALKQLKPLK